MPARGLPIGPGAALVPHALAPCEVGAALAIAAKNPAPVRRREPGHLGDIPNVSVPRDDRPLAPGQFADRSLTDRDRRGRRHWLSARQIGCNCAADHRD